MRTLTEKYRAVLKESFSKKQFLRDAKMAHPNLISTNNGFEDTVKILENKGYISKEKEEEKVNIDLNSLERGIRYELEGLGLQAMVTPDNEKYDTARKKAIKNLNNDPNHYLNLLSGESNKVDKHDREEEVKEKTLFKDKASEENKDTFNAMKKAELKEDATPKKKDFYADYTDIGMFYMEKHGNIYKGKEQILSDAQYEDLGKKIVDQLYDGNIKKAYDDLVVPGLDAAAQRLADDGKLTNPRKVDGTSIEEKEEDDSLSKSHDDMEYDERENFYNSLDSIEESKPDSKEIAIKAVSAIKEKYGDIAGINGMINDFLVLHLEDLKDGADPLDEFENFVDANYYEFIKKESKDIDRDGDIDSDDYLAAKDKAIKKSMGKDEIVKESIKAIITKILTEDIISEAATGNLSKFSDDYSDFEGMTQIINQLENLVTEVEGFYAKTGEKLQKVFDAVGSITNEEGLKVGGFIAPAIESAFLKDIRPVIKKGFMKSVEIPTVKRISSAEIDRMKADQGIAEEEMEVKQNIFSPPTVNGTL